MASDKRRKNPKRLECLKKKSKELATLCDVEVLFLCREDGSSSGSFEFHSCPEDANACLSLIDKYKKRALHVKPIYKKVDSIELATVLGKRKRRSDTQMELCENLKESERIRMGLLDEVSLDRNYPSFYEPILENGVLGRKVRETEKPLMVSLRNVVQKIEGVANNLGCDELLEVLSWVDQARMDVDERVQVLENNRRSIRSIEKVNQGVRNDGMGYVEIEDSVARTENLEFNLDPCNGVMGVAACDVSFLDFCNVSNLVSGNVDFGDEYNRWLEILKGSSEQSDQNDNNSLNEREKVMEGGESNIGDVDSDVFGSQNIESWLEVNNLEADNDVLDGQNIEDCLEVDDLEANNDVFNGQNIEDWLEVDDLEADNDVFNGQNIEDWLEVDDLEANMNLSNEFIAAYEEEMRQIMEGSVEDNAVVDWGIQFNDLEENIQVKKVENLMSSQDKYIEIVEIADSSDEEGEEKVELIESSYRWILLDFFDQGLMDCNHPYQLLERP